MNIESALSDFKRYDDWLMEKSHLQSMSMMLKNTEKLAVWKTYYTDAINALKGEDASRIVDRNSSRQESQS